MSEPRLTPTQLRRKAYALMQQCWLPLLIAALLTTLLFSCGELAIRYGQNLPARIEAAVFAEFEAENPRPADSAALKNWESERIAHAYFSCADIRGEQAEQRWQLIGYGVELAAGLVSAVILTGLYRGLLGALRGSGEPIRILGGFRRWKAALWLKLRVNICLLGWLLIPLLPAVMLSAYWGAAGQVMATVMLMAVVCWGRMYYALALPRLADGGITASECLAHNAADVRFFTVGGMARTAWPVLLVITAEVALDAAAAFLPALTLPSALFSFAAEVVLSMAGWAILACIYEEIRHTKATSTTESIPMQDFSNPCRNS